MGRPGPQRVKTHGHFSEEVWYSGWYPNVVFPSLAPFGNETHLIEGGGSTVRGARVTSPLDAQRYYS
jgi:hypothetical protein